MTTAHPRIMMARDEYVPWYKLEQLLQDLRQAVASDDLITIRLILKQPGAWLPTRGAVQRISR